MDSAGEHAVQVTDMRSGRTANPRWSRDGRMIVFNSWHPTSDLFTLNVQDGSVKQLTDDSTNEVEPSCHETANGSIAARIGRARSRFIA